MWDLPFKFLKSCVITCSKKWKKRVNRFHACAASAHWRVHVNTHVLRYCQLCKSTVISALLRKSVTQTASWHRTAAGKLESRVVQGAAYHEISTWSRADYMMGFIKISHETNCLPVSLCLINVNVAPALETTGGIGSKATKWCRRIIFLLAAYFF